MADLAGIEPEWNVNEYHIEPIATAEVHRVYRRVLSVSEAFSSVCNTSSCTGRRESCGCSAAVP